jgi:hypothetical protein
MFASPLPAEVAEICVQAELDRAVRSICGRCIVDWILGRVGSFMGRVSQETWTEPKLLDVLKFIDSKRGSLRKEMQYEPQSDVRRESEASSECWNVSRT